MQPKFALKFKYKVNGCVTTNEKNHNKNVENW